MVALAKPSNLIGLKIEKFSCLSLKVHFFEEWCVRHLIKSNTDLIQSFEGIYNYPVILII